MGSEDDPLVLEDGITAAISRAPTLCPMTVPGSLPGTACRKSPSKSGSSLSERNRSTRYAAAFSPPAPLRPPNSGELKSLTTCAKSRSRRAAAAAARPGERSQKGTLERTARTRNAQRAHRKRFLSGCIAATRYVRHNSSLPMGRTRIFFRRPVRRVAY